MIKYNIDCQLDRVKDGVASLRWRIRLEGKILTLSVGRKVEVAKWNVNSMRCKRNSTHLGVAGSVINSDIERLNTIAEGLISEQKITDIQLFKSALYEAIGRPTKGKGDAQLLANVWGEYVENQAALKQWTYNTKRSVTAAFKMILAQKPDITLGELASAEGGQGLFMALSQKWRPRTVNYIMYSIRPFLDYAVGAGWIAESNVSREKYKSKVAETEIVFLSWSELMQVYDTSLTGDYESNRLAFLLSCFTSLRCSDLLALTWSNVVDNEIVIRLQKTKKLVRIPLNKYSQAVLDQCDKSRDRVLDLKVDSKIVKKVLRKCGVVSNVQVTETRGGQKQKVERPKCDLCGWHTGRRTFICHALALGIPANVVMSFTGHSDYNAMKPYIAIADETGRKYMDFFNK